MKCPKCGNLLTEGRMYCEHCGYEIKLVPEFEARVEESIAQNIKGIVEEKADIPQEKEPVTKTKKKNSKKYLFLILFAGMLVFVLAAIVYGGMTIWEHSTIIHEMIAEYYATELDYQTAITYMEEIVQKVPDTFEYRLRLCELYIKAGRSEEAIEAYKIISGSSQFSIEEQITAVEKLIEYYEGIADYESIAAYLETVHNDTIRLAFLEYMCPTVVFSQPEGTYSAQITLKLTSDGLGSIHYTLDGTAPDADSPEFTETIFLETGDTVVSAVFINDYGVESSIVTKEYSIEMPKVNSPEVLTYSGTYHSPVKIQVSAENGVRVFYTTDGTTPNANSTRYRGELYAPIGKSVYKFIAIDSNGKASDIVTRDYQIILDTDITIDAAKDILKTYAVSQGKPLNENDSVLYDETHIVIFEYLYPMSVETGVDCYYFAEVARSTETGEQFRTNVYYGVDIRTGAVHTFYK